MADQDNTKRVEELQEKEENGTITPTEKEELDKLVKEEEQEA